MSILALLQASAPESLGVAAVKLEQKTEQQAVNFQGLPQNIMQPGMMLSPYALLAQTSQPQLGNFPGQFAEQDDSQEMTDNQLLGLSSMLADPSPEPKKFAVEATHGTIDLEDDMLVKPEQAEEKITDSERPPAQANAQLSNQITQQIDQSQLRKATAGVKAKGAAITQKNNQIKNKIQLLEGQIKREENLARKLKGDQINMKAKEQMTDIETHLDKQLNNLRNDLKISGQEAQLARLKAEQAVISQNIKRIPHAKKKVGKTLQKHAKPGHALAVKRMRQRDAEAAAEEAPAEEPAAEEAPAEEPAAEEPAAEEAPAEEAPAEEEPAAEEEAEPAAEEEVPAEEAAEPEEAEPAEPAVEEAPAAAPAAPAVDTAAQAAKDAANDAKTQELLDASKKMMEQSEAMQESLKKVEETVAANAAAAPVKTADEVGGAMPINGFDSVKEYFKGAQGVPKAKKFVKFLNLLTKMDEEDDYDDYDDEE